MLKDSDPNPYKSQESGKQKTVSRSPVNLPVPSLHNIQNSFDAFGSLVDYCGQSLGHDNSSTSRWWGKRCSCALFEGTTCINSIANDFSGDMMPLLCNTDQTSCNFMQWSLALLEVTVPADATMRKVKQACVSLLNILRWRFLKPFWILLNLVRGNCREAWYETLNSNQVASQVWRRRHEFDDAWTMQCTHERDFSVSLFNLGKKKLDGSAKHPMKHHGGTPPILYSHAADFADWEKHCLMFAKLGLCSTYMEELLRQANR